MKKTRMLIIVLLISCILCSCTKPFSFYDKDYTFKVFQRPADTDSVKVDVSVSEAKNEHIKAYYDTTVYLFDSYDDLSSYDPNSSSVVEYVEQFNRSFFNRNQLVVVEAVSSIPMNVIEVSKIDFENCNIHITDNLSEDRNAISKSGIRIIVVAIKGKPFQSTDDIQLIIYGLDQNSDKMIEKVESDTSSSGDGESIPLYEEPFSFNGEEFVYKDFGDYDFSDLKHKMPPPNTDAYLIDSYDDLAAYDAISFSPEEYLKQFDQSYFDTNQIVVIEMVEVISIDIVEVRGIEADTQSIYIAKGVPDLNEDLIYEDEFCPRTIIIAVQGKPFRSSDEIQLVVSGLNEQELPAG